MYGIFRRKLKTIFYRTFQNPVASDVLKCALLHFKIAWLLENGTNKLIISTFAENKLKGSLNKGQMQWERRSVCENQIHDQQNPHTLDNLRSSAFEFIFRYKNYEQLFNTATPSDILFQWHKTPFQLYTTTCANWTRLKQILNFKIHVHVKLTIYFLWEKKNKLSTYKIYFPLLTVVPWDRETIF